MGINVKCFGLSSSYGLFFHDIVKFLDDEQIPYMLTGSMAMSVYTVARATQDFDFVIQLQAADVPKVASRFKSGYYCNEDAIHDAIRRKSMFNIIEHATSFKADFILLRDNEFQQLQFSRRIIVKLLDVEAWVISGEDLILSKLIWIQQSQSGRQMEDIKAVSKFPGLDWDYIHHWSAKLDLLTFDLFKS
jgi:hypothetical protein